MTYLDTINYNLVGPADFELIAQDWIARLERYYQFRGVYGALCMLSEHCKAVFKYDENTNTATLTYVGI